VSLREKGTAMSNTKPEKNNEVDQDFPLQILYSSPPEAVSLDEWVRDIESKKNQSSPDHHSSQQSD
jgi:hypothetical protein